MYKVLYPYRIITSFDLHTFIGNCISPFMLLFIKSFFIFAFQENLKQNGGTVHFFIYALIFCFSNKHYLILSKNKL